MLSARQTGTGPTPGTRLAPRPNIPIPPHRINIVLRGWSAVMIKRRRIGVFSGGIAWGIGAMIKRRNLEGYVRGARRILMAFGGIFIRMNR